MTDPLGHITSHDYDAQGRKTKQTDPKPQTGPAAVMQNIYDMVGNLTQMGGPGREDQGTSSLKEF